MKTTLPFLALISAGCLATDGRNIEVSGTPRWVALETGSEASLRGVCAVSADVVWASGSRGTVLRSIDRGQTWEHQQAGSEESDLRDVEVRSALEAYALAITEPARILRTQDGGATWNTLYESPDARSFFDSLALFAPGRGRATSALVFGDPQDGVFEILRTADGTSWSAVAAQHLPPAFDEEAAFAASGTCITTVAERHAWIGTGGSHARVLRSTDGGRTWRASETPLPQGQPTTGIYSIAFRDARHGVVVGGDYTQPEVGGENAALTSDGGVTWTLAKRGPSGYRSAVAYLPGNPNVLVAVGRAGCDWSRDGGRTWEPFGEVGEGAGYYALSFAPDGTGYAVGAAGRAARLAWDDRRGP